MGRDWDFPEQISVPIKPDEDGFIGRECPKTDCEGYFKIECGTGLKGEGLPCHCPYCGHTTDHDQFWTKEQIEFAKSVAFREFDKAVRKELKKLEFDYPARGAFGIGISMKLKPGAPVPLRHYREQRLETEVVCDKCTLRYSIFGVFAYCPDCGAHNSRQILDKNLDLSLKQLELAAEIESGDLAKHLKEDALENVVSAFDGFGRELARVNADKATTPTRALKISLQNLESAHTALQDLFGVDIKSTVSDAEWELAARSFQRRHLLAHKMGVVDQKYIDTTGDTTTSAGRKITVSAEAVRELVAIVRKLGDHLAREVIDGTL